MYRKPLIIAVDFDGTLVEDAFPNIGKPKTLAFETLKQLQNEGHLLILWTYRYGKKLDEAVQFCKQKGIQFYAVNKSYPEEEFDENSCSRKIHADVFIDDRNINGLPAWNTIYQELLKTEAPSTKKWFSFLKK